MARPLLRAGSASVSLLTCWILMHCTATNFSFSGRRRISRVPAPGSRGPAVDGTLASKRHDLLLFARGDASDLLRLNMATALGLVVGLSAAASPTLALENAMYKKIDSSFSKQSERDSVKKALEASREAAAQVSQEARLATQESAVLAERALMVAQAVQGQGTNVATAVEALRKSNEDISLVLQEEPAYSADFFDWNNPVLAIAKNVGIGLFGLSTVLVVYISWMYQMTEELAREKTEEAAKKK